MTHILVVDNYDSFVYTLNGYLHQLGATTDVIRNDDVAPEDVAELIARYDGILVSPGPGTPVDAGVSIAMVTEAVAQQIPLLGVCLGHQAIAEAFGATVAHAEELMHGKTSTVTHDESTLFEGVPEQFQATRYHSLAVVDGTVPPETGGHRAHHRWRHYGPEPPERSGLWSAVPPRIRPHRGRLHDAR
jgi:para-aminobenzoate synthetase component 2